MISSDQITEALNIAWKGIAEAKVHTSMPNSREELPELFSLLICTETFKLAQTILIHENQKAIENLRAAHRNFKSLTEPQHKYIQNLMKDKETMTLAFCEKHYGHNKIPWLSGKQAGEVINFLKEGKDVNKSTHDSKAN